MKKLIFSLSLFALTAHAENIGQKLNRVRDLVSQSRAHGLQAGWYFNSQTELKIQDMLSSGREAELNQLLNSISERIAKDLYRGRVTPDQVKLKARIDVKSFPYTAQVSQFSADQISSAQLINTVQPRNSIYQKAVGLLRRLETLKQNGQWTVKPAGLQIAKVDATSKNTALIKYLRSKLNDFGYVNDFSKTIFDEELKQVVRSFQADHNLSADGVVGAISWSFLERSLDQLISQAILNIDRVRWLPDDITANYVFVNLAQQRLQLIENSVKTMDFITINGRLDRQTPMLVDRLKSIVLNPTWTVPFSIFVKDKIPLLRADPNYLVKNHMKLIDDLTDKEVDPATVDWSKNPDQLNYTIVQSPGPWNALGLIKFPLGNPYAIYLHDTNDRSLFQKDLRLLSSGCVRLSQPFEFAEKVLGRPEMTAQVLKEQSEYLPQAAETPTNLSRKTSLPVYLFYQTVLAEDDGRIISLNDHYEIDKAVYPLLSK
jgi:murein L,D-transpeptidase YcbB/YkuD